MEQCTRLRFAPAVRVVGYWCQRVDAEVELPELQGATLRRRPAPRRRHHRWGGRGQWGARSSRRRRGAGRAAPPRARAVPDRPARRHPPHRSGTAAPRLWWSWPNAQPPAPPAAAHPDRCSPSWLETPRSPNCASSPTAPSSHRASWPPGLMPPSWRRSCSTGPPRWSLSPTAARSPARSAAPSRSGTGTASTPPGATSRPTSATSTTSSPTAGGGQTSQFNGRLQCPTHNRHHDLHDHDAAPHPARPVTRLDELRARIRWRVIHDDALDSGW